LRKVERHRREDGRFKPAAHRLFGDMQNV